MLETAIFSQSKNLIKLSIYILFVSFLPNIAINAQQPANGTFRGKVLDSLGALISGATITVVDISGKERMTQTNKEGVFVINDLAVGKYLVRASANGFTSYQNPEIEVLGGKTISLDITLTVTITEQVTIGAAPPINTDPDSNASAVVLKDKDIQSLPDDPAELNAALQALAGPGAGPNGGEFFVDGFSGGKLPRRDTIREVRINQNPFSSEYDRLGLGRIEIFTKPGTEEWAGEIGGEFEDESFNSRNPFASNRPPFQLRNIQGELSGPIIKKRASFFVDFEVENIDNNAIINTLILNSNLNPLPFQLAVLTPNKNFDFGSRFDVQINDHNTLVTRYDFSNSSLKNAGLGGFDLVSRAYNTRDSDQTFRLTETAVINPSIINEARFQYIRRRARQDSMSNSPTIRVLDAFTSGGANIGSAFTNEDRLELQDFTSFILDKHSLKIGMRLRHVNITDASPGNFAGSFTFTSLDQYRNTILNLAGAFPTQFSIAGGDPQSAVRQTDLGIFAQDDWRVNAKLTLSFGLRYETQTNISDHLNIAPRFGFAYAPDTSSNKKLKTVFRGGFGVFYDRFSENLTLQTHRFNGVNQQQFVVTDPAILDPVIFTNNGVSNVPTIQTLTAFAQQQTTRVVSSNLQTPYTLQTVMSIEQQLPFKTTLSVSYVNAQTRRLLRSRNVNAPVNGIRPNPNTGNIFQYESTGRFNQNQLIFNFRSNFSERVSIFANYSLGQAKSSSDGAGTFPANSYDLSGEYGRAALDVRHRFTIGGNLTAPLRFRFSPFITFRSGVPFNITTGTDINGDTLFTDRPAFASSLSETGIVMTKFGAFDPTPEPGDTIIPRNYGRGSEFFNVNLRVAKEFGFGGKKKEAVPGGGNNSGNDDDEKPYKLEFSVQIRNILNHTNRGTPIGNLRSSFFGQPVSLAGGFGGGGGGTAGNRRVRFEIQFSF